jgi:hypothetical protein
LRPLGFFLEPLERDLLLEVELELEPELLLELDLVAIQFPLSLNETLIISKRLANAEF